MVLNKRKPLKPDALDGLFLSLANGSTSAAVRDMERAGQESLVNSDTLPTDLRNNAHEILEARGVKFLGVVAGNEIFQYVELPQRWKKVRTEHVMWTDLLDEKGRKRAAIFYDAAPVGASSHLNLSGRFHLGVDLDRLDREGIAVGEVKDGKETIYATNPIVFSSGDITMRYAAKGAVLEQAEVWLNEHLPQWNDPNAYWDWD